MSWFRSFKNQCSAERWKIPSSSFKEESYFYSLFTFHTEQQVKASIQCPLCISSTLIATRYEYPSMSTRATAWTGQWANNSISRRIWSEMADPVGLCSQRPRLLYDTWREWRGLLFKAGIVTLLKVFLIVTRETTSFTLLLSICLTFKAAFWMPWNTSYW